MPSLQEDLLPDHLRDDSDATANRLGNDHLHEEESRRSLTDLIVGAGAVGISTFVHAGILIILGFFTLTPQILESFNLVVVEPIPEVLERPEELVTIELEENIDPATELTNSQQSSTIAGIPNAEGVGQFSEPTFDTVSYTHLTLPTIYSV